MAERRAPRAKGRRECIRCGRMRQLRFFSPNGRVCVECKRKRNRKWSRERHLYETYRLSVRDYEKLLENQQNRCAICLGHRPYWLHVDHDHKYADEHGVRNSVRGLLCKRCNQLLGSARDDIDLFLRAAHYLENWPAKAVLNPRR